MGSSGWSLPLVRIEGRKAATNASVRTAMLKALANSWNRLLPYPWFRGIARSWILLGEDSLLTIQDRDGLREPATALTFWFYDSVDWASSLAEHWLRFAIAFDRPELEIALERLGFAIPAKNWPRLLELDAARYIEHANKVGRLEEGEVRWEAATSYDIALDATPLAELPGEVRERLAKLDRCACPLCERHAGELHPAFTAGAGHHIEPLCALDRAERVLAPRTGGIVFIGSTRHRRAWVQRSDGTTPAWTTLAMLSQHPKRFVDLIHDVDGTTVAILGFSSPKPARVASISRDGGATWSEPAATGLPELSSPDFFVGPHHKQTVHAVPRNAKQMFRSDDGGRMFGAAITPLFDGRPAHEIVSLIAFGAKRLVARWKAGRKQPCLLAISDDGGRHFTSRSFGDFAMQSLWASSSGVAVAFGVIGETPMLLRSHDEGATWTAAGAPERISHVHLGGRWFAIEQEVGIHVSDDEGATWTRVADGEFGALFPDEADPSSVYATIVGVAVRIVIGDLAPVALPAVAFTMPSADPAPPSRKPTPKSKPGKAQKSKPANPPTPKLKSKPATKPAPKTKTKPDPKLKAKPASKPTPKSTPKQKPKPAKARGTRSSHTRSSR